MAGVPQLGIPDILVDDEEVVSGDDRSDNGDGQDKRTSLRAEASGSAQRWSWAMGPGDRGSYEQGAAQHPLSAPRLSPTSPTQPGSGSGFNFEVQTPTGEEPSGRLSVGGGDVNRPARAVGSSRVEDMLDDSVWVESIRRSATIRRSDRGSYRYGDGT